MQSSCSLSLDNENLSKTIREAVKNVVKRGKPVTYDLGGHASTQEMAQAILAQCVIPSQHKTISLLFTGDELIQGDIPDANGVFFAKQLTDSGGNIKYHLFASDKISEIKQSLQFLKTSSDAIIVTGGLGPTTDDNTRFALSEAIRKPLAFSQEAWDHIVTRLKSFNLEVKNQNKQQALFPVGCELIKNNNGTAFGCYIESDGIDFFMLPGPPKENRDMLLNETPIPLLKEKQYFQEKIVLRWLTLGLIEGEISSHLAALLQEYQVEMGYRWAYPHLEIKCKIDNASEQDNVKKLLDDALQKFTISCAKQNARQLLEKKIAQLKKIITVFDPVTKGDFFSFPNNVLVLVEKIIAADIFFQTEADRALVSEEGYKGQIKLSCKGYRNGQEIYSHSIFAPFHGPEFKSYAEEYFAWQLEKFICESEENEYEYHK